MIVDNRQVITKHGVTLAKLAHRPQGAWPWEKVP
jgi:hypothetical protein